MIPFNSSTWVQNISEDDASYSSWSIEGYINFTNEELYKIECCIEGDGDNYKSFCDPLIKNIIDKIQNAYLEESN